VVLVTTGSPSGWSPERDVKSDADPEYPVLPLWRLAPAPRLGWWSKNADPAPLEPML
jgi:hypothetical protein